MNSLSFQMSQRCGLSAKCSPSSNLSTDNSRMAGVFTRLERAHSPLPSFVIDDDDLAVNVDM